jgi:RNA polymerase sigma-B factor
LATPDIPDQDLDEPVGLLWARLNDPHTTQRVREDTRSELVRRHMSLVGYLAARYRGRGEPLDELVQVASVGLVKAVNRFDASRGVAFSTFAVPTITGELRRHFRDRTWMVRPPRGIQDLRLRLLACREDLTHKSGRAPTIRELANALEIDEDRVIEVMDASNGYSFNSLEAPLDPGDPTGGSIGDRVASDETDMDLVECRESVRPLIAALPERERRVLFLRFFEDMKQSDIATELGISQMHVSRLITQIINRLRDELNLGLPPVQRTRRVDSDATRKVPS